MKKALPLEISTDKVDTEVPSPFSGTVTALLVEEGDTVAVGANLLELDGNSQDIVETPSEVPEPEIQEEPEIVAKETGESTEYLGQTYYSYTCCTDGSGTGSLCGLFSSGIKSNGLLGILFAGVVAFALI